jgi:hypothetical protein
VAVAGGKGATTGSPPVLGEPDQNFGGYFCTTQNRYPSGSRRDNEVGVVRCLVRVASRAESNELHIAFLVVAVEVEVDRVQLVGFRSDRRVDPLERQVRADSGLDP